MRIKLSCWTLLLWLMAAALPASAQEPEPSDSTRQALTRLTARLDSLERDLCPARGGVVPAGTDSLSRILGDLSARLERLIALRCATGPAVPADSGADDLAALRAAAAAAAGATPGTPSDTSRVPPPQSVARPRTGSLLNPEISATGDIRLIGSRRGDAFQGEAHEFEVALQSALDPYSSAKVFLAVEDEEVGVEEGYVYWTGLPGRLRVDAGLVRQQVGDLNRWHRHALPESEYPLVYRRFLGEEGLAGAGLFLYTALPVSLAGGTHEVWLQGSTVESEPLYGDGRHGTLLGRVQNFWQFSRSTYGQVGFTALGGNNSDSLRSRVLGLDLRLTWRPPEAGTRRDVTLRAEGYRLRAHELAVATTRYGAFVDLAARVSRRWILGARYDYVEAPRGPYSTEWQISPALTWWQSEFVYVRLEGQRRHNRREGNVDRLLLQAVFSMGPHKHETY
jgi:hypothetical protein